MSILCEEYVSLYLSALDYATMLSCRSVVLHVVEVSKLELEFIHVLVPTETAPILSLRDYATFFGYEPARYVCDTCSVAV